MLQIVVPKNEFFDESTQKFISISETKLNLEHSLISLSKWESKWHKPFLSDDNKTNEEIIDYIKCMTINKVTDQNVYLGFTNDNYSEVNDYIQNPMTATWFNDQYNRGLNRTIITNEVIYGWMVSFNIPFECEKWHLNRLLTLIRVCEVNSSPKKKMPMRKIIENNKSLNEERKRAMNTNG